MSLHCPNCGHKQICPCDACVQRRTEGDKEIKPWRWVNGIGIRCGQCGFEQGADWWEHLSYELTVWHLNSIKNRVTKPITKEVNNFINTLNIHKKHTPLGG